LEELAGRKFESVNAGLFLFAPFMAELGLDDVAAAGLPGSKAIPSLNYFLSFLALKLK
jgi:hypothetical protein